MRNLSLVAGFVFLVVGLTFAQESSYKTGTTLHLSKEDTLSGNVIWAGQHIEILGYLDNDLFSASRQLMLQGKVEDDAFLAGQFVSVTGTIGDMLVAVGETVIIDGVIDGDLLVAGREVRISSNARILGNAAIGGEHIILEGGSIQGWLRAAGSNVELNGSVDNFVELYSNDVTFGKNYSAAYSTTITGTEQIHRENLGVIPENLNIFIEEPDLWHIVLFQLWFFLSLMLTGLILIRIFQQTAIDMYRFATERVFTNTGIGLLALIGVPIAMLVLAILFITLPMALLLGMLYGLALFISYLLVAMVLGVTGISYFQPKPTQATYYWGLVLGMFLVAIFTNLPFIGWLLNLFFILFGLGSVIYYLWMMSRSSNSNTRHIPADE